MLREIYGIFDFHRKVTRLKFRNITMNGKGGLMFTGVGLGRGGVSNCYTGMH